MRPIVKGSTDQSVIVRIVDSTDGTPEEAVEHNSSGISLWYRREGGSVSSITPVALASANSAHSDGGIEHLDDGYYRIDLPDAAVSTGANGVTVGGTVTGMVVIGCYVPLVDFNVYAANVTVGTNTDKSGYALSASGITAIWDALTSGLSAVGSIGKLLVDNINATISSRLPTASYTAPLDAAGTRNALGLSSANLDTQLGDIPTVAEFNARTIVSANYALESTLTAMKGATFDTNTDSLEALRNRGDAAWTTATGFSTHTAADVWAVATRVLTAGTNIVLAKGTGITGFNDLSAAQVNAEVDTALADYDGPTQAEMVSEINTLGSYVTTRTLASAAYATAATQTAHTGQLSGIANNTDSLVNADLEVTDVPPATSTMKQRIGWLFALARNKVLQTATTQTLRNDGDTDDIATAGHSDDGTTYTRNEWQ